MNSGRNLTTTRSQVFGDVSKGTECRVCGRDVDDGRSKTCSDYCSNLVTAVMNMLNWSSVRRQIIDRDDETCQRCGFDLSRERLARDHIRDIIDERAGERPESPGALELGSGDADDFDWDDYHERFNAWCDRKAALEGRFGDPYERSRRLEVDHITPISEGGHPFDPSNLQTLCECCHQDKTARENSERAERRTPTASDLNQSLFEYAGREKPEDLT